MQPKRGRPRSYSPDRRAHAHGTRMHWRKCTSQLRTGAAPGPACGVALVTPASHQQPSTSVESLSARPSPGLPLAAGDLRRPAAPRQGTPMCSLRHSPSRTRHRRQRADRRWGRCKRLGRQLADPFMRQTRSNSTSAGHDRPNRQAPLAATGPRRAPGRHCALVRALAQRGVAMAPGWCDDECGAGGIPAPAAARAPSRVL
jgi:hypothetical protein